jgi:hypothetical protein
MAGKNHTLPKIIISILIVATSLSWLRGFPVRAAGSHPAGEALSQESSCLQPATDAERNHCSEIENRILAVTVMIELQAQFYLQGHRIVKETHSHATILAGRYLVTHNHYKFPLQKTAADGEEGYLAISLRRADGTLILDHAPLSAFTIAYTDLQTLVLEFINERGADLFAAMGLPSAEVNPWTETRLEPGDELARIDWNGVTPHVDWVRVEQIAQSDVPQIQVNDFVRAGSSGGGAYWNGQHIGNIWARNIETDATTDEVTRRYTIIALDSPAFADLGQ